MRVGREGRSAAWALGDGGVSLVYDGSEYETPTASREAVERGWAGLRARTPGMFDGAIVVASGWSVGEREVRCCRGSYKPYAAGIACGLGGPFIVAVTGFVVVRGADGEERVLLGRRGGGTWLYVGMWELAPSGGMPPPAGAAGLTVGHVAGQLAREMEEEAGLSVGVEGARAVALCEDREVHSLDVVVRVEAPTGWGVGASGGVVHAGGEYSEVAWVSRGEMGSWVGARRGGVIAPTVAILRALGWLEGGG